MRRWQIRKKDADLDRELRSDLALEEEEQLQTGLSPEEAHYAAMRAFGNPTLIREHTRAVWSWNSLETLLRDIRISVRTLLRSPGFSLIAVLVMALCIGATTSLFTVVRSVLFRPLPFRDPDRLVMLYEHYRDPAMNTHGFNYADVAPASYRDWRSLNRGFEDMAALRFWRFNLTGEKGELPEQVEARGGSWNLFPMLGVNAAIGRTFTQSEDRPDSTAVLLTWSLFERRFRGDPSVVSRQIHLDGKMCTVVGVLPKWFTYPDAKVQLWVPYESGMTPEVLNQHDFHFARVIARLRPDVSLTNALRQLSSVQYQIHMQNLHEPVGEEVVARTLLADLGQESKKPLLILLCAGACMLVIGCLNVANLIVARSAARQKEIAIRSALGARRFTLIRVQLMESLLVSFVGGMAGVLLSLLATKWLAATWKDLPTAQSIRVDSVVLAFACALIITAALLAGLLPAVVSTGKNRIAALQASSRSAAGSLSRTVLRKTLLTIEIAVTVVLLIAAGLLLKSFWHLTTTEVGCTTDNVLTMSFTLPSKKYDTPARVNAFDKILLEQVRALPGVKAAALGWGPPGAGAGPDVVFTVPEHPPIAAGAPLPDTLMRKADPGYFSALQIPLLHGRSFSTDDRPGLPKTAIVSSLLARQYFPEEDPLGKHLHIAALGNDNYEIIGVVADTLYQVSQPAKATIYLPVLSAANQAGGLTLAVRTASDPLTFAIPVQRRIAQIDPDLPVFEVLTLQQIIAGSYGSASLSAGLVLAFAVLSLMLASVGLYGVLSYLTTQRTGEIGIRLALGAPREQVVRLMLGDGMRPALYGLVLGFSVSFGAVRLVESMLYGTHPFDPAIFASVAATLLIVSTIACLIPAWRASRVDPMQALRTE